MGVHTRTVTTATCDVCQEEIDTEQGAWIDASVYGAAFHVGCWLRGAALAKALGLDDIDLVQANGGREKAIYSPRLA